MSQLENIGVFGDYAQSQDKKTFNVIFVDNNLNLAKNSLKRIQSRPILVEVFSPYDFDSTEGWPGLKPLFSP